MALDMAIASRMQVVLNITTFYGGYTSVIEVSKDKNADHYNQLRIVSETTEFSRQEIAVLCLCIQHLIAKTEVYL